MAYDRMYHQQTSTHSTALGSAVMCLDGVPFKLGEKFKCPQLPNISEDITCNVNLQLLTKEYSFTTETAVLKWMEDLKQTEALRKLAAAENAAKKSEGSSEENEETRVKTLHGPKVKTKPSINAKHLSSNQNSHPANFSTNVLLPVTIVARSKNASSSVVDEITVDKLDISLFEKVDDLFDNLELQTINDMEELKSVLEATPPEATNTVTQTENKQWTGPDCRSAAGCKVGPVPASKPRVSRCADVCADVCEDVCEDAGKNKECDDQQNCDTNSNNCLTSEIAECVADTTAPIVNGAAPMIREQFVNKSKPLPAIRREMKESSTNASIQQLCDNSDRDTDDSSSHIPECSAQNVPQQTKNCVSPLESHVLLSDADKEQNVNTNLPPSLTSSDITSGCDPGDIPLPAKTFPRPLSQQFGEELLSSTNDPSPIGDTSLMDENSCAGARLESAITNPPVPMRTSSRGLLPHTDLAVSWNHFSPLPGPDVPLKINDDPYNRMSEEAKHFVDNLMVMGFPRARLARAVEHFGQDEKVVVEHLCLVNRMCDEGHKCGQSEMALRLYNNDYSQASLYMQLFKQFQELGFNADKIRDAIFDNNINRDRALDSLMASS